MKIGRRRFASWLAGAGAAVIALPTKAHGPDEIEMKFDLASGRLEAKVIHFTTSPRSHFIQSAQVSVNDMEVVQQTFTEQGSGDMQEVVYLIPGVKKGAKIKLLAICNVKGKLEKTLEV